MDKTNLGDRMKMYERCNSPILLPNTPIVIRVDGKAFHSFTKNMKLCVPFDEPFITSMVDATIATATEMQSFRAAYVQSDEATFVLHSDNPLSESWFGGKTQKLTSISAAYMSINFNGAFAKHKRCVAPRAIFDSRAFSVTSADIPNTFLWRMQDWRRNSLQMFARSFFSHKQLHKKDSNDIHDMLTSIGESWYDLPDQIKNGTFIIKKDREYLKVTDVGPDYLSIKNFLTTGEN